MSLPVVVLCAVAACGVALALVGDERLLRGSVAALFALNALVVLLILGRGRALRRDLTREASARRTETVKLRESVTKLRESVAATQKTVEGLHGQVIRLGAGFNGLQAHPELWAELQGWVRAQSQAEQEKLRAELHAMLAEQLEAHRAALVVALSERSRRPDLTAGAFEKAIAVLDSLGRRQPAAEPPATAEPPTAGDTTPQPEATPAGEAARADSAEEPRTPGPVRAEPARQQGRPAAPAAFVPVARVAESPAPATTAPKARPAAEDAPDELVDLTVHDDTQPLRLTELRRQRA